MDFQFPNWLKAVFRSLSFLAIPNLGGVMCGIAVISFFMNQMLPPEAMERILFHPQLVLDGEWWRVFSFIFTGRYGSVRDVMTLVFFIFYLLYTYYIVSNLEQTWGATAITVYLLFGYVTLMAISFLILQPLQVNFLVSEYLTLAFGTLYPNMTFNLYGILPVKAKWFAYLAAFLIVSSFWGRGLGVLMCAPLAFLPYILFFGEGLIKRAKSARQIAKNRARFNKDMWR